MYGVAFLQSGLIRNTYFFFLPTQVLLSTRIWVRFSEWHHTWALSRLLICWLVWLTPFVWSSTFLLLWSWASSSFCGFGCIPPSLVAAPIFNGFLTVVEGDSWCVWTCVGCINWTESRLGTSTVWFCCLALTSPLLSSTCRRRCMESWLIMAQTLLMWRDIS